MPNDPRYFDGAFVDGYEVYQWPEFKALCARLNVGWELPTTKFSLSLEEGEPPKIVQEYNGLDMNKAAGPRVVDTTTMQNKEFRTHAVIPTPEPY